MPPGMGYPNISPESHEYDLQGSDNDTAYGEFRALDEQSLWLEEWCRVDGRGVRGRRWPRRTYDVLDVELTPRQTTA
jgi:hypothetical protein